MNPLDELIRRHAAGHTTPRRPADLEGAEPPPNPPTIPEAAGGPPIASVEARWAEIMDADDSIAPDSTPAHDPKDQWKFRPASVDAWKARLPRLLTRAPDTLDPPGAGKYPAKALTAGETGWILYRLARSVFRDYERLTPRPVELALEMLDRMEARADRLPAEPSDGWPEWVIRHASAFMDPSEDAWFDAWRQMSLFEAATESQRYYEEWKRLGSEIRPEPPGVGGWLFHSSDPRAAIGRRYTLKIKLVAMPLPPTGPYKLEPLTGSPKQIDWANALRDEKWPQIEQYARPKAFDPTVANAERMPYGDALRRLALESEAKFWIDRRFRPAPQLAEEMAQGWRTSEYPYTLDGETVSAKGGVERLLDLNRRAREQRTTSPAAPRPIPPTSYPVPSS